MPPHYFADSVISKVSEGKTTTDTLWHTVGGIRLINQLGDTVSLDQLRGRVIIADFFFTHCPSFCPSLTRNLRKIQDQIKTRDDMKRVDTSFVQFLSFSVDPERDSPQVLKRYADRYGINPDIWWLLTGPKKTIYDFALQELKLGLVDGLGVDSNFIHTQKMVLLDRNHVVRGYYDGLDSADLSRLAYDMVLVALEKDKNSRSALADLKPLLPLFFLVIFGTTLAVVWMQIRRKKSGEYL